MSIIDLIILLFIALMAFIGYKKGLINIAFSLISFFIAIVMSFLLFKPVSNIIVSKTNIDESIQKIVYEKISSKDTEELDNSFGSLVKDIKNQAIDNTALQVSEKLSTLIINLISWIAILIITKIILLFFKSILNAIANLPFLKQINKTGRTYFWFFKRSIYYISTFSNTITNIKHNCNRKH